jgi:hypothetical protein
MNQQQELPQTREELNVRIDLLWREELEWVRQHPNPDLTEFNELIEKETSKSTVNKLPPLDIAMWPQDVFCDIDVSNPEKFNDRFIELPTDTRASGFEKFFWGFHNGMSLFLFAALIFGDDDVIEIAFMFGLLVLGGEVWKNPVQPSGPIDTYRRWGRACYAYSLAARLSTDQHWRGTIIHLAVMRATRT